MEIRAFCGESRSEIDSTCLTIKSVDFWLKKEAIIHKIIISR